MLLAALVLFGVAAPVTSARADLSSSGNQLWQQGAAGLADQPESESRIPLADAGVFRTRGDGFGSVVASGDFNGDRVQDVAIGAPDENAPQDNVIDKTPPTIVATRSTPINGISTVTFTCSDALSGIRDCPAPVQVGQFVMAIRSATDRAGNTAMAFA